MAVSGKYASDDTTEADRPLNAESGRKCVRNIQSYPILSTEWIVLEISPNFTQESSECLFAQNTGITACDE